MPALILFKKVVSWGLTAQAINFAQSSFMGHRICFSVPVDMMNEYFTWKRASGEVRPTGRFVAAPTTMNFPTFATAIERYLGTQYTDLDGVAEGLNYTSSALDSVGDMKRSPTIGNATWDYSPLPASAAVSTPTSTHYGANDLVMAFVLNKCFGASAADVYDVVYNLDDGFGMLTSKQLADAITASMQEEENLAAACVLPAKSLSAQRPGDKKGEVDAMFRSLLSIDPQRFYSGGKQITGLFETNTDAAASGNWRLTVGDKIEVPIRLFFRAPVTVLSLVDGAKNASSDTPDEVETVFIKGEAATFNSSNSNNVKDAERGNIMAIRLQIVCSAPILPDLQIQSPSPPRNATVIVGDSQATVSWSAPLSDGGSAITGYIVASTPGGLIATSNGTTTTAVVTGLTNGTAYTFAVIATNVVGNSTPSTASSSVTPRTVPGAPTDVSGVAGNCEVSVSWASPSSDGGSTITGYTVTSSPGGFTATTPNGTTTTAVVTGLTNGTAYTFAVVATNAVGNSSSASSSSVTPRTVPDAPTDVSGVAGDAQASVSWAAPVSDGGSALTGYTVTSTPGGFTATTPDGSTTSATVTGLTNGTAYTFAVVATNAVGNSSSASSSSLTPYTVPGAPTDITAVSGNSQITLSWSPPLSNGGSAITSYTVTSNPGGLAATTPDGTTTTAIVSGLTNGTSYIFTVVATNTAGSSEPSSSSLVSITNTGGFDTFIVKYLANGSRTVWAKSIGGTVTDYPVNMALDSAGNVYSYGYYNSTTLNIPGFTPNTLTRYGQTDTFLLKYLTDGTEQWAKNIGGTLTDQAVKMVSDSAGNVYATGYYNSATLNIPGFSPDTLTNSSGNDVFILKYLADGTPQWAKNITGPGGDQPVNMNLDSSGNLYVTGYYGSTTLNIPGFTPDTLTRYSGIDVFILKYLADGTPQWAKSIGGSLNDYPVNMVSDSSGNVYIYGYYTGTVLNIPGFSPDTLTNSSLNTNDTFILKYSSDGTPQWAKNIGGTLSEQPVNIEVDSSGNLYVTGYYNSLTLPLEAGFTPNTLTNSGSYDTFILKYLADGTPQWAKNIGGTVFEQPVNMVVDSSGNLYVSGSYSSRTITLETGFTLTNSGLNTNDIFILKYSNDISGTLQWAKSIGGTSSETQVNMLLDSSGNLCIAGSYSSTTMTLETGFTPNTLKNSGSTDTFILKYLADGTPQWAKNIGGTGSDVPVDMKLDSSGNVYLTGRYASPTINFSTEYIPLTITAPSAPTSVSSVAGNTQATVSWYPPSSNGGSAITGYTVTSSSGGLTTTVSGTTRSATFTELTNGTAYTFTVVATNLVGSSVASSATSVTPRTVPDAPTSVTAVAGNAQATVSWAAPFDGGSAITGYTVSSTPEGLTASVDGVTTSAVLTGLTNGTAYTFAVVATNAAGNSTASSASSSVTPQA